MVNTEKTKIITIKSKQTKSLNIPYGHTKKHPYM